MSDASIDPGEAQPPRDPLAVITLGETMAMIMPAEPESLRTTDRLRLSTAGAESNVAIALSRLGLRSAWVGRIGADDLGSRVVRDLRAEGVETYAVVDDAAATGLMIKEPILGGRLRVRYYRHGSAGSRLHPDDAPAGLIESAHLLHLTGITPALSDSARAAVVSAVERARVGQLIISLDLNLRRQLWSDEQFAATLAQLVPHVDLVFGSADEVRTLLRSDDTDVSALAAAVAELGPREVVIKGGTGDSLAWADGKEVRQPAFSVPVVNTVGAGDAFVAGYLYGRLIEPADVSSRLAIAAACGALACTAAGDWEATPTRAELNAFLVGADDDVIR